MSNYAAKTIMRQYGNSPVLLYLLACMDKWVDPAKFSSDFLTNVWNISTAQGFGLDIWGRILGVTRVLQISAPAESDYFGFANTLTDVTNKKIGIGTASSQAYTILGVNDSPVTPNSGAVFTANGVVVTPTAQSGSSVTLTAPDNAVVAWTGSYTQAGTSWSPWGTSGTSFYDGEGAETVAFSLPDTYYRQLLMVKAAANIARCDCPSINALMRSMFGSRGRCYVGYDIAQPMHIAYHFEFFPTSVELAIIESGLFPQPAGTLAQYLYETLSYTPFGFREMNSGADPEYVAPWSEAGTAFYMPANAQTLP